jgi:hypothetical protein
MKKVIGAVGCGGVAGFWAPAAVDMSDAAASVVSVCERVGI